MRVTKNKIDTYIKDQNQSERFPPFLSGGGGGGGMF